MEMTILQAVLCGVVYWLAVGNLPFVGLWSFWLDELKPCFHGEGIVFAHRGLDLNDWPVMHPANQVNHSIRDAYATILSIHN